MFHFSQHWGNKPEGSSTSGQCYTFQLTYINCIYIQILFYNHEHYQLAHSIRLISVLVTMETQVEPGENKNFDFKC